MGQTEEENNDDMKIFFMLRGKGGMGSKGYRKIEISSP